MYAAGAFGFVSLFLRIAKMKRNNGNSIQVQTIIKYNEGKYRENEKSKLLKKRDGYED